MIKDKSFFEKYDRFAPSVTDNQSFYNPYLFVNWNMGNVCTYQCSYCSRHCHSGSFPWPKIEEAVKTVKVLDRVYKEEPYNKQKIVFELLGGEITLWKGIDVLLSVIKDSGNITMLVTNGVRTLDWWKKNGNKFEWVTLSYHSEFADYKHLCDVSNLLIDLGVATSILVLMYSKKWEKCVKAYNYFKENSQATISLQRLTLISTSKDGEIMKGEDENKKYHYSEDQMAWLSKNKEIDSGIKPRYDLGIGFFDSKNQKSFYKVTSSFLSINNLNNWKNWNCYIGIDSLYLEQNGDVRRSVMCRVKPALGSRVKPAFDKWRAFKLPGYEAFDENLEEINWPTEPVLCPYTSCFCSNDHRTRKQKIKT